MEINQLKYFLEICKTGSMARAASNLHITQQGISIAIRRLEAEAGQNLFYHKSKGLMLSEFGEKFRDEAEIVITHVNSLYELCNSRFNDGKTPITVAITRHRITKLPPSLQQMLILPPDEYRVTVVNEYSDVCAKMVSANDATFALVYGDYEDPNFDVSLLETVKQVFVVNKDNPFAKKDTVSIKELDGVPLLIPDSNTRPGKMVADLFKSHGASLNIAYECNWPHQAIDMVAENPTLVARTLLADVTGADLAKVKVLRLEDDPFTIPFNLLVRKNRRLTVHEQLFKHLILDCYR